MSIIATTRRGFLKGACILAGGLFLGVRMANEAYAKAEAAIKDLKAYMGDRADSVYANDAKFAGRGSQDNAQVKKLYETYLGKPLGEKSEHLLHTKWIDRSAGIKALKASGKHPGPRAGEFAGTTYPYEK